MVGEAPVPGEPVLIPRASTPRLCASTLDGLTRLPTTCRYQRRESPDPVAVPRFDKTAHGGRGDRCPEPRMVHGPVDCVVLEGWCLGFRPSSQTPPDPALRPVHEALRKLEEVYALFDAFVLIAVPSPAVVYQWREEAEAKCRERGQGAMTPDEVRDFVDRYMPCYRYYLRRLEADPGAVLTHVRPSARQSRLLRVDLDSEREPIEEAVPPELEPSDD